MSNEPGDKLLWDMAMDADKAEACVEAGMEEGYDLEAIENCFSFDDLRCFNCPWKPNLNEDGWDEY